MGRARSRGSDNRGVRRKGLQRGSCAYKSVVGMMGGDGVDRRTVVAVTQGVAWARGSRGDANRGRVGGGNRSVMRTLLDVRRPFYFCVYVARGCIRVPCDAVGEREQGCRYAFVRYIHPSIHPSALSLHPRCLSCLRADERGSSVSLLLDCSPSWDLGLSLRFACRIFWLDSGTSWNESHEVA